MTPHADHAVTAPTLRRALISGAQRVIAGRDRLNRINVFPVADGDTGNNLAFTLGGLLNGALRQRSGHLGALLQRVGEEAIDGARGNSGAILAQFLHGIAEHAHAHPVLDAADLAAAVGHGARQARAALSDPVEGTILSVIDRFAEALAVAGDAAHATPRLAFAHALGEARTALARTPEQMPLLRMAGVVDAGAQGFVDLLEGIAEYVDGGPRALRLRVPLASGAARLRVHAHIGAPQALFDTCAGFGAVEGMKADDMLLQSRSAGSRQAVAIVTDSAADLPEAVLQAHPLHVVPLRVNLDGRDYLDKVGLGTSAFYRRMAAARDLPRTSQPPPGDFRRVFEFLRAHHADVVYVGLSRAVSGTLQAAEHAAGRIEGGGVRVFDTVNAAGGQALLAWRAAELAASGADAGTILRELERLQPLTLTWAMARDIRHAVRGGRIPAWAAPAVRFSGLTPVARMRGDGTLGIAGGLIARARAPEAFAAYAAKRALRTVRNGAPRWRAIVGHCDAAEDGQRTLDVLRRRLDLVESHLVETGPAVGAHAGRGALVVALQPASTDEVESAAEASV
jgi:hypothetical protein